MSINLKTIDKLFRVAPGQRVRLKNYDSGWMGTKELRQLGEDKLKERAKNFLKNNLDRLADAQERLWASDCYSVLLVFQAMDAAGKDGTIKHVMSGVNPQGCQVFSFKQPSSEDLDHNYLWRYMRALPERGRIGIFNRSYYEEVLVLRVHPEILEKQKLPPGKRGSAFWQQRYTDINSFEQHLAHNGTIILKFFLHVSKDEQKRRFLARIDNQAKQWKFSPGDLAERAYWDEYVDAFEQAIGATSTAEAPWYIIPADHKFVTRTLVAFVVTETLHALDLRFPKIGKAQRQALAAARKQLLSEK